MNKKLLLFLILLLPVKLLSAQDIKDIFKILPATYTEDLNVAAKDSLLKGKDFYPANNDSNQIVVYRLEKLDSNKNFLRVEMSFESGQAGYVIIELRSFKTTKENWIIVLSKVDGTHNMFNQNTLVVFSYNKPSGLTKTNLLGLIQNVSIRNFIKPNTPTSMIKKYKSYSSVSYELGYLGNITLRLAEDFDLAHLDKKWLLGTSIEFIWNSNRFVKQKLTFKD